ncbi:MAG: hypothetical protein WA989_09845, partial [Henriciella sp.]|uniref:hypothetical protein n=1 Tax=Henriciella sp. TaxID=1968823 RepID=UPI003C785932
MARPADDHPACQSPEPIDLHALMGKGPQKVPEQVPELDPAELPGRAEVLGYSPPPVHVQEKGDCQVCGQSLRVADLIVHEYAVVHRDGGSAVELTQTLPDWVRTQDHLKLALKDRPAFSKTPQEMEDKRMAEALW